MIGRRPSCHRVAEHCAADDPCTVYSYYHTKLCSIHQSWARDNCIALRQRQRANVIELQGQEKLFLQMLRSRCQKATTNIVIMK